jgi:acetoin utilization deacetylase AcuC-like enzyme
MKVFYAHHFVLPLPEGHSFPMQKYRLLHERVGEHAEKWGIKFHEAPQASEADLLRVHCPDYVQRMLSGNVSDTEMRRIGFPWSAQMVERSRRSSGATMAALRCAIEEKDIAVNLAGGTHHAAYDRGGGYCVFNDAVIAARYVQSLELAQKIMVIDLDVHHGNGTASLCEDDDSIFTFSMHHEKNYPAIKPQSNLDIALKAGTSDADYLDLLAMHLPQVLQQFQPDAVIYLAGADPFIDDRLGGLALSKPGLAERDRRVMQECRSRDLPMAIAMAGGYALNVLDIVDIHNKTVMIASNFYSQSTFAA